MAVVDPGLSRAIDEEIERVKARMIEVRRNLHRNPERSKREQRTSDLVASYLEGLKLEVTRGKSNYGVMGLLRGAKPGRTVALRADMDALKVQEQTGLPFASQVEGVMHACGHDAHTAMLLAVAEALVKLKDSVPGNIKFLFQPSEEAFPGGALGMIEDGALENPRVDAAFACHVNSRVPSGCIGVKAGPVIGAVAAVNVKVKGVGGHFGRPHLAVDPIVVAAHVIISLQSMMTRQVDPNEQAVLSFGTIQGGTRDNVIAEEVIIRGDLGAMNTGLRDRLPLQVEKVAKGVAESMGATAEVDCWLGYPAVVNDPGLTDLVSDVVREVLGEDKLVVSEPTLGGEDFSYFTEKVPAALWELGCWDQAKYKEPTQHHHPKFDLDEEALPSGAKVMANIALAYLFS